MAYSFNTHFGRARTFLRAMTTLTAVSLLSAGAAQAKSDSLFDRLKGQSGASGAAAELNEPAQTLPAPKNPKPFRQTKRVFCDAESVCTFLLQKVKDNKVLELHNISCYSTAPTSGAILTKSADPDDLVTSIVAVIPSINETVSATNGSGPYLINGGEQVIILMNGVAGELGVCSIYGTIAAKG